jgi:hypothetical protein
MTKTTPWRLVRSILGFALLAWPAALAADDEFTLYDLLAPETHQFAIVYDVTATREGARFYLNPIREGSVATDERVVERRTGRTLRFEVVTGKQAKEAALLGANARDEARYIKVELPEAVPKGAQTRLRIFKTYTDPRSYLTEGDRIVFDRGLGIRRNAVLLPAGYELVGSSVPAMVTTEADGRVKVSFFNDRDDQLPVRVVGRRVAAPARQP